jgi:hypothetical protein
VIARVSLAVWITLLAAIALAAVIVMVKLDDPVGVALALGALAATAAAILVVTLAELTQEASSPVAARCADPRLAIGLGLSAVVMLGIAAVEVSHDQRTSSTATDSTGAAVQTARDYVTAAALDQNGENACGYLTAREQERVARLAGPNAVCRDAFSDVQAASTVPGSVHAVQGLAVTTKVHGTQVDVLLGRGSGALSFVLRHATASERLAFDAPPSAWRVTRGATSVLAPRVPARMATASAIARSDPRTCRHICGGSGRSAVQRGPCANRVNGWRS